MKKTFFTTAVLLLISFMVSAKAESSATLIPTYDYHSFDQLIQAIYRNPLSHSPNITTRVEVDSSYFLGKKYILGALGEGIQGYYDQSPLYRTDAFDCVTFISTVLALAESDNLREFQAAIQDINYSNGKPSFATRNHFMEIDWNPQNSRKGYIRDITRTIKNRQGQPVALLATNVINKPQWFRHLSADHLKFLQPLGTAETRQRLIQLHAESEHFSPQQSQIYYLPFSQLFTNDGRPNIYLFQQIPAGAIIELVRPNWPSQGQYVSHTGLTVIRNGVLLFREASSHGDKVMDIPLVEYLATYFPLNQWNGINVQQITPLRS